MKREKAILCVEDSVDDCKLIEFFLVEEGFQVMCLSSGTDALDLAQQKRFSALILDNWLEGMNGIDLCQKIRSFDQETPYYLL